MYIKYANEPVDTEPSFSSDVVKYEATMDWKMKFFSVQAQPVPPAVIENIVLCRQDADCTKEEQSIVVIDFSRSINMMPGSKVRFRFDVIRHGEVKTFTIVIRRLQGSETNLRTLIGRGLTLWPVGKSDEAGSPGFKPNVTLYQCLMDVTLEIVMLELHLQDSGQTVVASASPSVLLEKNNHFTLLKNSNPGHFKAPPLRRLTLGDGFGGGDSSSAAAAEVAASVEAGDGAAANTEVGDARERRRLMNSGVVGEFQYPNRYVNFPVPLTSQREIYLKVISADGGHHLFYSLKVARSSCPPSSPLFDVGAAQCVRFCNSGFFGDTEAKRCKRCQDSCFSCLASHRCTTCPKATRELAFELDNVTGTCEPRQRSMLQEHPQKTLALLFTGVSVFIFLCGLCGFRSQDDDPEMMRRKTAPAETLKAGFSIGEQRSPQIGQPGGGGAVGSSGVGRFLGRGGTAAPAGGGARYMPVAGDDYDDA